MTGSHPMTGSHGGVGAYAVAGWGGRQPVSWTGPEPRPSYPLDGSLPRPVVAVLDTGVGDHPWLDEVHVDREPTVLGVPIGRPTDADPRSAATGVADLLVGELSQGSGHGTFIAGLVRQACPEARILDVQVLGDDGVVVEADLLRTLQLLGLRQVLARNGEPGVDPVDVVSMSLGYYHEHAGDADFDPLLRGPLELLGRLGVAVVVSAGNDASGRPIYPAAFAPYGEQADDEPTGGVPVSAVGALNPDGTIALFSNDGPWVGYLRPGASLVSTMPVTFDASRTPSHELREADGEVRAALDPDDFSSGFGVWSGTSFAAPVFAGELAAALAAAYRDGDTDQDAEAAVGRLRRLLAERPGRRRLGGSGEEAGS